MAVGKEIRVKIKSIQNTQKITKAMEMVAASKMRRAQDRMLAARPYAEKISNVFWRMAHANSEYKHPFLIEREQIKRVGFIVITSDRGLCGGLNVNLFRRMVTEMKKWSDQGVEIDVSVIGNKGLAFFKRMGGNIVSQATHLGDAPSMDDLIGTIKTMLDSYSEGNIDRLFLFNNEFVNTMTQTPALQQIVPAKLDPPDEKLSVHWDYIYEPDAQPVMDALLTRYLEAQIYKSVVENIASEQSSRMVAMKAATDNAGNLIDELQLIYNKARQAAITQEISEIVGGAAAV